MKLGFLGGIGFTAVLSTMDVASSDAAQYLANANLKAVDLPKGYSLAATFGKPKGCGDPFCKFLGSILQDDSAVAIMGSPRLVLVLLFAYLLYAYGMYV